MSHKCQLGQIGWLVLFRSSIAILIFFLLILLLTEKWLPTVILGLSIFFFQLLLYVFWSLLWDTGTFKMAIPFDEFTPSLLWNILCLVLYSLFKVLCDINRTTPVLFFLVFEWYMFSSLLLLTRLCFYLKWVYYRQHVVLSCFVFTHLDNFYL